MKKNKSNGQSMVEYAFIIGIVVTALLVMQVYMKRSIQAVVKTASDELGGQDFRRSSQKLIITDSLSNAFRDQRETKEQIGKTFKRDMYMSTFTRGSTTSFETETGIEPPGEKIEKR
jgi:hypothetical protein